MHDFEAAKKKAASEKKDLLIDFTGSDWCPPCQDLSSRILSLESFKTGAEANYILVELDFPRTEAGLAKVSQETQAQNRELATAYNIKGFPTILLTDAQGRPYGQTGHRPGTPEEYLAHLAELQKNKTTRDEAFANAESAEGVDKARALYMGLKTVPEDHHSHYVSIIDSIKENDPEDALGMRAAQEKKEAAAKKAAELQAKMGELDQGLRSAMEAGDVNKATKLVDEFIAKEELTKEEQQQILSIKINLLMETSDLDAVEKVIDEIIAVDPKGQFSARVKSFKETQLQQLREARDAEEKAEETPAEKE